MQKLTNQEKMKPWMGFVLFFVGLMFLYFIGSYMQTNWGMIGLILTELGFLAISLLYCVINKVSIKEVFPIKKITGRDFVGTIFMLIGGFLANLIAIGISMLVLSALGQGDITSEVSGLSDFLYGNKLPYIIIVLIVALTPAICEEAFMRGAILSSFRGFKRDWGIVLLVGVFFGILHLSPLRFLNTACLGAILAYIMVKKNNFLLPMLVHFLNNFLTTIAGVSASGSGTDAAAALDGVSAAVTFGSLLAAGFLCPLALVIGARLYDKEAVKGKHFAIAGILSALLLIVGIATTIVSSVNGLYSNALLNWNYTFTVDEEALECDNLAEAGIEITEVETHTIIVSAVSSKANITFTMVDENGEEIITESATGMLMISQTVELAPGHYTLYFTSDDTILGKSFSYQVIVQ
jgi:membrane protease YdiL (CAAX protease family)